LCRLLQTVRLPPICRLHKGLRCSTVLLIFHTNHFRRPNFGIFGMDGMDGFDSGETAAADDSHTRECRMHLEGVGVVGPRLKRFGFRNPAPAESARESLAAPVDRRCSYQSRSKCKATLREGNSSKFREVRPTRSGGCTDLNRHPLLRRSTFESPRAYHPFVQCLQGFAGRCAT
jgi:hypothetical protein